MTTTELTANVFSSPPSEEKAARKRRIGQGRLIWRRFLRNRMAVVGACVVGTLVLLAVFGPMISPWGYLDIDYQAFLSPPSAAHLFGTTKSGRDVLTLSMFGLRKSLIIGMSVAVLQTGIAALVGASAAYFSGWMERVSLWVIDLLLVVPEILIIAIIMRGRFTGDASWVALIFLLAFFGWMMSARVIRSLTMSLKHREYILAAKYMGLSPFKIIVRHILPNISSLMIIDATLNVGYAILSETALSFLGFGVQAPDTSLGTLIGEGQRMATTYPWIFSAPAIILVILVMAVNAMGDGLRDALDPSSASGGQA